jgi:hypothetical protein
MLYAILCYNREAVVTAWSKEKDAQVMAHHEAVLERLAAQRKLGPVARLMPTTTATTLRDNGQPIVMDGPFAETKEQLLGFYLIECSSLDEALELARPLASEGSTLEIRPVFYFNPGVALK